MIKLDIRQTQILFALIRAGLWKDADEGELIEMTSSLSEQEWKVLFRAAKEQGVTGIFTDGMRRIKEQVPGCYYAYLNGVMLTGRIEKRNRLLADAARALTEEYPGSYIFKGPLLTCFYPIPLHRETGDIDVIVPGLKEEVDYTRTFRGKAVSVELHPWPEFLYSPFRNRTLQKIIRQDHPEQRGKLSIEVNLLCLMLHIRRHVLSDGFGFKQLCDIAVILQNHSYDPVKLEQLFRRTGCRQFAACLMKLLAEELGVRKVCPTGVPANRKAYGLLRRAFLEEGYDNKEAWRNSSGWMESAWLRWSRCLRMYPLVGTEALWMPFYQAVQRRKRNKQ